MPPLMAENKDAVAVYGVCMDQMLFSVNGPVALDIKAIEVAMKRLKVKDKNKVFFQVLILGRHFIEKMRDKT